MAKLVFARSLFSSLLPKVLAPKSIGLLLCISLPTMVNATPEVLSYGVADNIESKAYDAKRRFMVSLPERYQAYPQRHYPVLYVMDGDFQFRHTAMLAHTQSRMGKLPPMIVVGIANQGNPDYLYSTTWKSEKEGDEFGGIDVMMQHLSQELVPYIDKHYRTSGTNAVAGYSLGGLFVLQAMMAKDTPFSAFISMSPSLWYDNYSFNNQLVEFIKANKDKSLPPLFLSVANEQGMGIRDFHTLLTEQAPGWQVTFNTYPNETHYTTAIPAMMDGLNILADSHYTDMDELMEMADYQAAFKHFADKQSQWAGYRMDWLQAYYLAKYLFASKQIDQLEQILASAKTQLPDSYVEIALGISKGFNKTKQAEKAASLLESIKSAAGESADWYQQMSLAQAALGHNQEAETLHRKAIGLAQAQGFESWEVWELGGPIAE